MKIFMKFLFVAGMSVSVNANGLVGSVARSLVECSEECTPQGSCASGQINVCHAGEEDECIDASEWNEHCSDFGDTCGACPTSGSGSGTSCFSGASTLVVQGKGIVSMEEAQIGDMVLTSVQGAYEPIYAFGHHQADKTGKFLKISTDVDTLEITAEHLVHVVGKSNPVRADSLKVGDNISSVKGAARVLKVRSTESKGLYAPLTPSGQVVVNSVVASSYIALDANASEMTVAGHWKMSHRDFVHLTLAPFRAVCMGISNKPCQVYDEEGIPLYIRWGIDVVNMAHDQQVLGYAMLFAGLPIAAAFLAIEYVFGPSFGLLAVLALGLAAKAWRKARVAKTKTV